MELKKMDLLENILQKDGVVHYFGPLFSEEEAQHYLRSLLEKIDWQHDELVMFGKKIVTKRKVGWYGDEPFKYTYSNASKVALPWTRELLQLKSIVEKESKETYNSCLVNLYHDGSEGMGWHADDEKELKENGAIASLSFGATRKFVFRHKESGQKLSLMLEVGSLLVMKGVTQTYWQHSLPPTRKINSPRINVTFRTIRG